MKNYELNTPAGRVIFVRAPKRLTPQQVAMALQSMADDDPRWLAVHQLIDEELVGAMLDATSETETDQRVRHAGGRAAALSTLKKRLMDERKRTMEAPKTAVVGRKGKGL